MKLTDFQEKARIFNLVKKRYQDCRNDVIKEMNELNAQLKLIPNEKYLDLLNLSEFENRLYARLGLMTASEANNEK